MARARRKIIPFGLWPSPIAPQDAAVGTRRFGLVQGDGAWVYWTEGRPQEKGRQALLRCRPGDAAPVEMLKAPWSVRSRVHEYGGGEFLACGDTVFFVNDADQDVYELVPGRRGKRITHEPEMRFADLAYDRSRGLLFAVAERHGAGASPQNLLVTIALSGRARGTVRELAAGRDFYAAPCLSADGGRMAFVAWDLPDMPWDQSEILIADLDAEGRIGGRPQRVAGGDGTAAAYPSFLADGTLAFVSDRSGFGRITLFKDGRAREVRSGKVEFGRPLWTLGARPYAVLEDGRIAAASVAVGSSGGAAAATLAVIDPGSAKAELHGGIAQLDALSAVDDGFAAVASPGDAAARIEAFRVTPRGLQATGRVRAASEGNLIGGDAMSRPEPVTFRSTDGASVHAFYFAPASASATAPAGTLPPALVLAHGGPTSMTGRALSPRIQFYTSRGFAVLDVDYAGSTGYGRAYRGRLDSQWGIADVADCAAGARFLAAKGLADAARIAIAGGSAGGYTTLMALATTTSFAAGASHYGISDLALLMEHTHKFESGYLHRLLGTTPKAWKKVCRDRSPLHHIGGITAPLILFQGLEDKVVPPEQSRRIAERLRARGGIVELHEFPGEAHGFRRAETIAAVLEAELGFLRRAMRIDGPS